MKRRNYYVLLLLFGIFFLTSCGSSDDMTEKEMEEMIEPEAGTMTAEIDSVPWEAEMVGAAQKSGILNITGTTSEGEAITLTVKGTTIGTYDLNPSDLSNVAGYIKKTGGVAYTSNGTSTNSGEMVISELNEEENWVTGTFSFNASSYLFNRKIYIENGVFTKIPFIVDTTGITENTLFMKVDGVDWNPTSITSFIYQNKLFINGSNSTNNTDVGLTVPIDVAVGEYDLDWITDYLGTYTINNSTILSSEEGKIIITEHDETFNSIEGTFYFKAEDVTGGGPPSDITEGVFSILY